MAPPPPPSEKLKLPPELRRKFSELERRLWLAETARASAISVAGLALAWLAVFFSDRIWDTPVWLRLGGFLAGAGAVLGSAGWWLQRWGARRRSIEDFAVLVQKRYRRLGDTLLGVVELADETRRPAHYSPALYGAAIRQVALQAEPFDFREAVPLRPVRLAAAAGGGLLAVVILLLVILPAAALNAFRRWVAPTAAIARHTLVELDGLAARQVVAHGEPFEVTGTVRYRSFWKPARGTARFERQLPITFSTADGRARFQVAGQVGRGVLRVRVGDATRDVEVLPAYRPALHELAANIEYPAYLQYPPAEEKIGNGILSAVEGSRVRLAGTANRPLATATLSRDGEAPVSLNVTERVFRSEGLALPANGVIAFDWRDSLGLTNAAPWKLTVQSVKDAAPAAGFDDLAREVAILESELLELKVAGRDDFGVKEVGVNWEVVSEEAATNATVKAEFKQAAATPREQKFEETFSFNPGLLNIPPDSTVELRAYATDFLPGREPAESIGYRVQVLGNERHSELVRQKLEALLARLEEVTRLEEKVAAATREALTLGKEKFEGNEGAERAAKLAQEQMQAARQLDELAEEGVKTLREATRNPAFADEKLREWAKNMQAMQDISGEKMKQAAKSLQAAKQQPAQREEKLGEALAKEEESLKALEELQQNVNESLDDLQAMTLAQRLRKLGADQQAIRGELQRIVPEIIGLLPTEVPDRFRKAQDSLANEQAGAQKETGDLQGELGRFFERTRRETYGRVNQEMTQTRAPEELEKVRGQITENITMEAIQQLLAWSKRFEEWADVLEPKENQAKDSGDQSPSNAAGQAEQMLNQLMALLRLREGQVNLRERTRLLEKQKAVDPGYDQRARMLASGETKLMIGMHEVQQENPIAELGLLLEDTMGSMRRVENILSQPRTDQVAAQAHTKTVEMLTDVINLINEQAKRNQNSSASQSASAEEMAFLMEMMAQQQGQSSGMAPSANGSSAGGGTDRAAQAATGDATGKNSEGRNVGRATGVTGGNVPTEFREALENYFNALEKSGK